MDRDIALGIVRELYGTQPFSVRKALSELIPGLVRKEDRAIKETLKELVVNGGTSCYVNGIHKDEILAWLEKQGKEKFPIERLPGEMKTVSESLGFTTQKECDDYNKMVTGLIMSGDDKVEPKFNVGDWVVNKLGNIWHIDSFDAKNYQVTTNKGEHNYFPINIQDRMHLWTIQDAKPGDVLYHKAENGIEYIVMNKGLNEHNNIDSYFRYNSVNGFGTDIPSVFSAKCDSITPATKEQRDLLFQKMKEDGYEWDAEKKELKKIEDEEYNGEDYGIDSLWHAKNILEETLGKVDGYQTDDGILEHKCAIAAVNKLYKQKPAEWGEEDEDYYDAIITKLEVTQDDAALTDNQMEFLKSLKGRVQPKQEWSEEDEKMIGRIRGIIEAYAFSQSAVDVNGDLCEKKFIDADIWLKRLKERIGG